MTETRQWTSDRELNGLIGDYIAAGGREDVYLYTSRPGDGQTRVVFQDKVCQGYGQARAYMRELIEKQTTKS